MARRRAGSAPRRLILAAIAALGAGCQLVSGLDQLKIVEGGGSACAAGEKRPCYTGPDGTSGVGACKDGVQVCGDDGSTWGACTGQIVPADLMNCADPTDVTCDGKPRPCTGATSSVQVYGGPGDDDLSGVFAGPFPGWLAISATYTDAIDLGAGPIASAGGEDAVLGFFSSSATGFTKRIGDTSDDHGDAIVIDSIGDVILAGSFQTTLDTDGKMPIAAAGGADAFVAVFDKMGRTKWKVAFGDASDQEALAVAVTNSGNVAIAGIMTGALSNAPGGLTTSGPTDADGFVAVLDAAGTPLWAKRYGDAASGEQRALAVSLDKAQAVLVGGEGEGAIDLGNKVPIDPGPGHHGFLVKLTSGGTFTWGQVFAGAGGDARVAATAISEGTDVVVVGSFAGTITFDRTLTTHGKRDVFVAKLDPTGKARWSASFGDAANDQDALAVVADQWGNVIVAGEFWGQMAVGLTTLTATGKDPNAFVFKLRTDGQPLWARSAVGGPARAAGVGVGNLDAVYVGGSFTGSVDWGNGPATSHGGRDIFIAHLAP